MSVATAASSDKEDMAEVVFVTVLNKFPLTWRNSETSRFFKQQAHRVQTRIYGRKEELDNGDEENLGRQNENLTFLLKQHKT